MCCCKFKGFEIGTCNSCLVLVVSIFTPEDSGVEISHTVNRVCLLQKERNKLCHIPDVMIIQKHKQIYIRCFHAVCLIDSKICSLVKGNPPRSSG